MSGVADKISRLIRDEFPDAELYELGAFLTSSGIYLVANAMPDMWPRLKETAILVHQLLNQKENAETWSKDSSTPPADHPEDRRTAGESANGTDELPHSNNQSEDAQE